MLGAISVVGVLALFELVSRTGLVPADQLPPVSEILRTLADEAATAGFWTDVATTLKGWGLGLALAAAIGIPVGVLVASNRFAFHATRPIIEFCRPIPSVALIPLAVIMFGAGTSMSVFLVTFAAVWPILALTSYGVRDVDRQLLDTARSFGIGRFERLTRITIPSAVPYVLTGLRISSAIALILAITAELVAGSGGLGQAIVLAQSGGAVTLMYALIVATGLLALALNGGVRALERRLLHWHPSQRPR